MDLNDFKPSTNLAIENLAIIRVLGSSPTESEINALMNLLKSITHKHTFQAEALFSGMSKLYDKKMTADSTIGAWYQFGNCNITDLQAGVEKRQFPADLAAQSLQSSITGCMDLGNINMPDGLGLFFMLPNTPVDIKAYELDIDNIDTLKSMPTVVYKTARLVVPKILGVLDYANAFFAKDQWNLKGQNLTQFNFRHGVSFPMKNTSVRLSESAVTNRIFTVGSYDQPKFNEVLYDSFDGLFNGYEKDSSETYFVTYPLPLLPVSVTFDFGVDNPITVNAVDLAALVSAINTHPILSTIFLAIDASPTLTIASIDPNLPAVACIVTTTTVGATINVNVNNVFDFAIAIDRCHVYSQNSFAVSSSRNWGILGADKLRIVITPVTDMTNSATSLVLESLK